MKKYNNKSGFTLIEIIVVMIIIGILAAIALPNLFQNIQKSRAAQAISAMDSFKSNLEGCLALNSTLTGGQATCTLTGQNLLTSASIWTFAIPGALQGQTVSFGTAVTPAGSANANNTLTYTVQASDGTNTITLTRGATGTWACSTGTQNPYTGIC